MKKQIALAGALISLSIGSGLAQASTITFNDFSDISSLTLNGTATTYGNPVTNGSGDKVLRLTNASFNQGGSAFLSNPVSLASNASFSTAFRFQITNSGGSCDGDGCGADGLVFVVQTVANNVGGAGGGMGYDGIGNSVGIEFDTWNNGGIDGNDGNHVGIDLNGNIDSVARQSVATRMNNGAVWYGWVDYDGATDVLEVRLSENSTRPVSALLSQSTDLTAVLGSTNAFVGFTSGTGAAFGDHDILSWTFVDNFAPIDTSAETPEPATALLLGLGLLGFGVSRARTNRRG